MAAHPPPSQSDSDGVEPPERPEREVVRQPHASSTESLSPGTPDKMATSERTPPPEERERALIEFSDFPLAFEGRAGWGDACRPTMDYHGTRQPRGLLDIARDARESQPSPHRTIIKHVEQVPLGELLSQTQDMREMVLQPQTSVQNDIHAEPGARVHLRPYRVP
ncbi:unnamed protein product [Arctogadus glacialis]